MHERGADSLYFLPFIFLLPLSLREEKSSRGHFNDTRISGPWAAWSIIHQKQADLTGPATCCHNKLPVLPTA